MRCLFFRGMSHHQGKAFIFMEEADQQDANSVVSQGPLTRGAFACR